MARKGIPGYCRQRAKPEDRAYVQLAESRIYLGVYGSDESKAEYERVIAEWRAGGQQAPIPNAKDEITSATTLVSVLKEWDEIAIWLVQTNPATRKPAPIEEAEDASSGSAEADNESPPEETLSSRFLRERVQTFSDLSELLIAWGDQTIHADMSPIQDLIDLVMRLTLETDYDGSRFCRPAEADVFDAYGKSLNLIRRLELAASIAPGIPAPPRLNEKEQRIGDAIRKMPFSEGKDIADATGLNLLHEAFRDLAASDRERRSRRLRAGPRVDRAGRGACPAKALLGSPRLERRGRAGHGRGDRVAQSLRDDSRIGRELRRGSRGARRLRAHGRSHSPVSGTAKTCAPSPGVVLMTAAPAGASTTWTSSSTVRRGELVEPRDRRCYGSGRPVIVDPAATS